MLKGKKILLGITGSIAAYKAIYLVRLLIKEGAEVKVLMTPAAKDFVSPLTLSTLSKNPVVADLFNELSWSNHVMLGRWADVMVIAPLSCNTLAKMATGQCDNLLLATYLSATCPVVLAPAMDEDMWHHPATKNNCKLVESFGNKIISVVSGELASGLIGEGRMAEPEQIFQFLIQNFFLTSPLQGKNVLVTAGPTYEPIDPVRFIGNYSSGKMGVAIAEELSRRGANVTLVIGPSQIDIDKFTFTVKRIMTAEEMLKECEMVFPGTDIAIMSAAVADYRPVEKATEKIKKSDAALNIELTPNPDILKILGSQKKNGQVLVGFALETTNEKTNAKEKLIRKNANLIVLNSLNDKGVAFGADTNRITIFSQDGQEFSFETKTKSAVAKDIIDTITKLYYA